MIFISFLNDVGKSDFQLVLITKLLVLPKKKYIEKFNNIKYNRKPQVKI